MIDNCIHSTKLVLKGFNIEHIYNCLKNNILSHSCYSNILSISDTLKKYNIVTLAANIYSENKFQTSTLFINTHELPKEYSIDN